MASFFPDTVYKYPSHKYKYKYMNLYCKYMSSMQVPTDAKTLSTNWSNVVDLLTSLYVQTALRSPRRRTKFKIIAILYITVHN